MTLWITGKCSNQLSHTRQGYDSHPYNNRQIRQGKYYSFHFLEERTQVQRGELICTWLDRKWQSLTAPGKAQVPTGSGDLCLIPLHHYKVTCKSGKFLFLAPTVLLLFSKESGSHFMVLATQKPHLTFSFFILFSIAYFCEFNFPLSQQFIDFPLSQYFIKMLSHQQLHIMECSELLFICIREKTPPNHLQILLVTKTFPKSLTSNCSQSRGSHPHFN